MYQNDRWMGGEKVTRHKGIAVESSFSLAMFRWVNKIIDFIKVTEEMNEIGINEIEGKIDGLKLLKTNTHKLLSTKNTKGTLVMFKRLKANNQVNKALDYISELYSQFDSSESVGEYSMDFESEMLESSSIRTSDFNLTAEKQSSEESKGEISESSGNEESKGYYPKK